MDSMGSAGKAAKVAAQRPVVVATPAAVPTLLPAALPSGGAAQFAAAFFPPRARAVFAGMPASLPSFSGEHC